MGVNVSTCAACLLIGWAELVVVGGRLGRLRYILENSAVYRLLFRFVLQGGARNVAGKPIVQDRK